MTYTSETLVSLRDEFLRVSQKYQTLLSEYLFFSTTHPASQEYILHGFVRRIGTLHRCIQNVFTLYHPARSDIPSRDTCLDLAINLQSFVFNAFGCLDNLSRIWMIERKVTQPNGRPLRDNQVSFRHEILMASYASDFRMYIEEIQPWFRNLDNFRHALAHRIPLYVAPFVISRNNETAYQSCETKKEAAIQQRNFQLYDQLNAEEQTLGKFLPTMTHSLYTEDAYILYFHGQVFADWNTIMEIGERFLRQWQETT